MHMQYNESRISLGLGQKREAQACICGSQSVSPKVLEATPQYVVLPNL